MAQRNEGTTERSRRINQGQIPSRYTQDFELSNGRRTKKVPSVKALSTASFKSATSVKKLEVQLAAQQKLRDEKNAVSEKRKDLKLAQSELVSITETLESLEKRNPADPSMISKIDQLTDEKIKMKKTVAVISAELDSMLEISNENCKVIEQERDVDLEKVSDDEYQSYSGEEDDKNDNTEKWVNSVNHNKPAQTTIPKMTRITLEATEESEDGELPPTPNQKSIFLPPYYEGGCHGYDGGQVYKPTKTNEGFMDHLRRKEEHDYHHQTYQSQRDVDFFNSSEFQQHDHRESLKYEKSAKHTDGSFKRGPPRNDHTGSDTHWNKSSDNSVVGQLVQALHGAFGNAQHTPSMVMKGAVDKDLPKFDGNPGKFENFRSEFQRTTIKYRYEDSENISRLQHALRGNALAAVEHLLGNQRNLSKILEVLEKRFGRPEFVLEFLINKAKNAPAPDTNKPETVVAFGTAIEALVTNVCSYNETHYMENRQLVAEFVKKLPSMMKMDWYEWLNREPDRKPNLKNFADWLEVKVNAAILAIEPKQDFTASDENKQRTKRGPGGKIHLTAGEDKPNPSCPACGKNNHKLEKCFKFSRMAVHERWNVVKDSKVCLCCLRSGHRSRRCPTGKRCVVDECPHWHHSLLHSNKVTADQQQQNQETELPPPPPPPTTGQMNIMIGGCDGPLQILPVKIRGPKGTKKGFALLDGGASRSLLKKSVAEELGISGELCEYSYHGINGHRVVVNDAMRVSFDVAGDFPSSSTHTVNGAITVDGFKMKPYSFNLSEAKRKWPHLQKVRGRDLENVVPDILIGNNNPRLMLPHQVACSSDKEPVGLKTVLGWTVAGNFDDEISSGSINIMTGIDSDNFLHQLIKESFTTENFGVKPSLQLGNNPEERRAFRILEDTAKRVEGGWEVGLLWRDDYVSLPNSETLALSRLFHTERKLRDPEFKRLYEGKIEEYLAKGYARKLKVEDTTTTTPRNWYIPHFGVYNPNKPGKIRLVMDAAAKTKGVCLNDKLMKGPDLIRSLVSVLWNFRRHRIALTGDISDMFHRVKIRQEDRCSQRFLWRNGEADRVPDHYQMEVMIFGATSSPSSAIYIKNRNAADYMEKYPAAAESTVIDFFVDDCLTGGDSVEEVIRLREQLQEINEGGGFHLCKWLSNDPDVMVSIPEEIRAAGFKGIKEDKDAVPIERVLGMWWQPEADIMTFRLQMHKVKPEILSGANPTKREMCGLIMSVYDPLGFINQFKIKGLMLLQQTWQANVGWDEILPEAIYGRWKEWLALLKDIINVKVSRCYSQLLAVATDVQLHVMVDASEEAFCAIYFLRVEAGNAVEVTLIGSKARVAPLKKLTIPRLELQAALLGCRVAATIGNELKVQINSRVFWSDSRTVLCWIRSPTGKFKEFVANRVGEIQESSEPAEWRWVPTKQNVADQGTRFVSEIEFSPSSEWYSGPEFLRRHPSEWPKECNELTGTISTTLGECEDDENGEVKNKPSSILPPVEKFTSFIRMSRAAAAVKAAAGFWLNKMRQRSQLPPWRTTLVYGKLRVTRSFLSAQEISLASLELIKKAQRESYSQELDELSNGKPVGNKSSIWRLSPILLDGILRVDGRLRRADVDEDQKFPIILPPRHHITDTIINDEHVRCGHQGKETAFSNIRKRYWIPDGRHAIIRSWARCYQCRLKKCKPLSPKMGELPAIRLQAHQHPFTFTGLDFFGPMEVTVGRRHEKRWGALFCCMVTRAVHVEVAHSLSTDEAIMAISRFVDSRGRPKLISSDNGTNFVGAARELKAAAAEMDFGAIMEHGKFHQIEWKFIPPGAPHMGGAWERLVQSVKKCLAAVLKEKFPKDTTLLTAVKAAENMVNSRPLTHISADPADPAAITPNHLLRGDSDSGPGIPAVMNGSDELLRVQWRRSQVLANQFWKRWTSEFLPKLLRREKWEVPCQPLQRGDLVFIVDENLPRNVWTRGFISKIFPGADGQVRVVEVTVVDPSSKRRTVYKRPSTKICPLGLRMEIQDPEGS